VTVKPVSEELRDLLTHAVARGEVLLILGQDHSPAMVDQVLLDAKAIYATGASWGSLAEVCAAVGSDHAARTTIASLFAGKEPDLALLELASLPWMSVVTSAIDPLVSRAFLNAGSQRRLVELGPTQISGIFSGRATQVLQLVRAFGTTESDDEALAIPTSAAALSAARLLRFPAVAAALPRLVGVRGRVVVTGVTGRDWLDEQALAPLLLVLSSLPSGTVYWFGPAPQSVHFALSDKAQFFLEPFDRVLFDWTKNDSFRAELTTARTRVFGVGERVATFAQRGQTQTVRFTASEWRSISAVGSIIDDSALSELAGQPLPTRRDLIGFLRKSHAGVPDWSWPARTLIFERAAVRELINAAEDFVAKPKVSVLDPTREGAGVRRIPFLLSGPPASGKTTGLIHAAWMLRKDSRLCVLWLFRRFPGPDIVAIERVCRMLEAKGVGWTIICFDSPDPDEYGRMKRRLESEGRRVLILGTESRSDHAKDEGDPAMSRDVRRFPLRSALSSGEESSVRAFMRRFGLELGQQVRPDFLHILATVIPETQFGAFPSLLEEYERVLAEAKQAVDQGAPPGVHAPGSLAAKLREVLPHLTMSPEQVTTLSRFESVPLLRDLLNIVLFCSQLERPVPLDFLIKALGTELIANYQIFSEVFTKTALVDEIDLDEEGSLGLVALHQLYALWLLRGLFPERSAQLGILERIITSVDWDSNAFPGDNPYQDFALELLRAVGPRGEHKDLYSSNRALARLGEILKNTRERFAIEQPKLLTLEAIVLGDLAIRETQTDAQSATARCQLALELLDRSEELLRARRPTDVRNFELLKTLTLAADLRGTMLNVSMRAAPNVSRPTDLFLVEQLQRIESDAVRAQSYLPGYSPLDVAFWAHRDALDFVSDLSPTMRSRFIETMASILETAEEETFEPAQRDLFRRRQQELLLRKGEMTVGENLAREMREQGDFAGELAVARYRLLEVQQQSGDVPNASRRELLRLLEFRPTILNDLHAVRFLQTLWIRVFLNGTLGQGFPQAVRASEHEWRMLADITQARLQSPDDSEHPYALFFQGWALLQLGEGREGREIFARLERQSLGNPRRVGELAWVTNEDGSVRILRARVLHPRAGQVRLSIPEFGTDIIDLRPEVETELAPAGLRLGEYVEVAVALNYRGLLVRSPKNERSPTRAGPRR